MKLFHLSVANKKKRYLIALAALILAIPVLNGCTSFGASKSDTIHIATKGFAESDILANAFRLLIEHETDLKAQVETLDNAVLWGALKEDKVDVYAEYTGTALINLLNAQPEFDPQKAYEKVKNDLKEQNQLTVLDPIGFNNTYAFGLHEEQAEKFGITTTSELAKHSSELVFGASEEFMNRPDAWLPILETYDPQFSQIRTIQNPGLAYQAIEQRLIDSMILYTTDSQITAKPIVVLEDDKNVFLPYYAVPIVRDEVLERHPDLEEVLNKLAGKITNDVMQQLNGQVELEQRPPLEVAREWLTANGLLIEAAD